MTKAAVPVNTKCTISQPPEGGTVSQEGLPSEKDQVAHDGDEEEETKHNEQKKTKKKKKNKKKKKGNIHQVTATPDIHQSPAASISLPECGLCQSSKVPLLLCSRCRKVHYCNVEHQKAHWPIHKAACALQKAFEVHYEEQKGRVCRASRDIAAGELIHVEQGIVVPDYDNWKELCFNCCAPLKSTLNCGKCGSRYCSHECQQNAAPLHALECSIVQKLPLIRHETRLTDDSIFLVIRVLNTFKLSSKEEFWEKISKLEAHLSHQSPELKQIWLKAARMILKEIHLPPIPSSGHVIDETEISSIFSKIDVNSFPAHTRSSNYGIGLFPLSSLFSHSCVPNATFIATNGSLAIRATSPIKKGDEVTFSYVNLYQTTSERRKELKNSKFFVCSCPRCMDMTEGGRLIAAVKCANKRCQQEGVGWCMPLREEEPDSEEDVDIYECLKCGHIQNPHEVHSLLSKIGDMIASASKFIASGEDDKGAEMLTKVIEFSDGKIHPQHELLFRVYVTWISLKQSTLGAKFSETITIFTKAIECAEHVLPKYGKIKGDLYYSLGKCYEKQSNSSNTYLEQAKQSYSKAYENFKVIGGENWEMTKMSKESMLHCSSVSN